MVVEEVQDQMNAEVFNAPGLLRYPLILAVELVLNNLAFSLVSQHAIP